MCADIATSIRSVHMYLLVLSVFQGQHIAIDEFCREQNSGRKATEGEAGHTGPPNSLHIERRV